MIIRLVLLSLYVTWSTENKTQQTECTIQKYSYMVVILYGGGLVYEPSCSGTLISQYWVLTSGSCLTECSIPKLYTAVAGADVLQFMQLKGGLPNSSAQYCYLYPDLTRTVDLALMELEIPLKLSERITYVNLATYLDVADRDLSNICKEGTTVGLGISRSVTCVQSAVVSPKKCKARLNYKNIRKEHCCVSALKDTEPCPIAKGGPLMCGNVQYGVVTYSYSCSNKDQPVLVTRVDKYEEFIKGVIMERNIDDDYGRSECSTNYIISLRIFTFLLIFRLLN